jgi:hypothetical protein
MKSVKLFNEDALVSNNLMAWLPVSVDDENDDRAENAIQLHSPILKKYIETIFNYHIKYSYSIPPMGKLILVVDPRVTSFCDKLDNHTKKIVNIISKQSIFDLHSERYNIDLAEDYFDQFITKQVSLQST